MQHLENEYKAPLYTLFSDMSRGIVHIRAHGWQSTLLDESIRALDFSQKPFHYVFTIQQWLELAMDLTTSIVAISLVAVATANKKSTTEARVGLSMLNLVTFSILLNQVIKGWITLQTSLGAISRLYTFVTETPREESREDASLPPYWPHTGDIEFENVTARYQ